MKGAIVATTRQKDEQDTTPVEKTRVIRQKELIRPFNRISVDFRFGWGVVALIACALSLALISNSKAGGLCAAGIVVLYIALIWSKPHEGHKTTSLTYGFRKGNKRARDSNSMLVPQNLRDSHTHMSEKPVRGEPVSVMSPNELSRARKEVIKRLGRIDLIPYVEVPGAKTLGIVHDQRDKTYSGTAKVAGRSMLNADPDLREEWLEAMAHLLDSMVDVRNFTWQLRSSVGEPQNADAMVEHLRKSMNLAREAPPNRSVLVRNSNADAALSFNHELSMTVSLYGPHIKWRDRKLAGGKREQVLVNRLKSLRSFLMGSDGMHSPLGLTSANFLTYNGLVREMLWSLDPVGARKIWGTWAGPEDDFDLLEEHLAFPDTADFKTSGEWCRIGRTFHMGYYIERFPKNGLRSEYFWKILGLEVPKTITAVHYTVRPGWGQMRAVYAANATSVRVNQKLSDNHRVTGFDKVALSKAEQQELELAEEEGYSGEMRVYIDLTGKSLEEVKASAAKLEREASGADFIVKPLDDLQHLGIDAAMCAARGLVPFPLPGSD